MPAMVLATQIASGGRICQRRRSLEFETHIFTLDPISPLIINKLRVRRCTQMRTFAYVTHCVSTHKPPRAAGVFLEFQELVSEIDEVLPVEEDDVVFSFSEVISHNI